MIRCASDTRWTACVLLVLIQRIINEILNILISQLIAQNNLNVLENENGEWGYLLEHIIDETTHSGLVCYMSRAIQVIMEVDKRLFKIQKRLGHKAVRLFNMQSMTSSQTFLLYLNEWKKVRTGLSHVCETGISLSSLFGDIKLDHHFDAQQQKNTFMNEFASDQRPFEVLNDHDLLKFNFESFFILRRVRYHLCDIFCHFLHTLAEIGLLQHECLPRTTTQSRILQLKNSDPDLISSPCLLGRNLMEMCPLDLEWPPLVQGTQGFHTNAWHPLPLILDSNHFNLLSETFKTLIEALLKRFFHLPSIQRNWLTSLQFILDPKYSSLTQGSQLSHAPFKLNCVEKRDGCFTFSNVSQQMPSSEWETLLKREVYNNSLSLSSFFKSRPEPGLPVSFWRNLLLSSFNGSTYDICCVHQKLLTLKGATLYCIFLIHKKIPLLYIGPGRRRKVHSESRRSLRHTYHYYSTRNETMKSNWVEHPKVSSSCYFNGCYCCSLPLHDIPVTFSLNIVFKVSVMLREQEHEGFFYNISPLMIHVMSILGIHSPNSGTSLNVVNRYVAVTSRVILFLCKKPHGKTVELKEVLPLSSILLISETPTPLPQLYIDFFTQNEARIPFPKNHLTYMGTVSSYNALLHQTIHGDLQASKSRKFNNQNNISYLFKLPDCPLHSSTNHDTTTIELMAYADVYRLCIQFKGYTDKFALLERIQVCFREMSNYTISRLNQMFYRCDPPWRS